MTFDPYGSPASAPVNPTPVQEPIPSPWETPVATHTTREDALNTVSATDKISITFKYAGGFDQPWVVFKATSIDEASELLREAASKGLLEAVGRTAQYTQSLVPSATAAKPAPGPALPSGQPVGATQAPAYAGNPPSCQHGVWIYKTGVGSNGRPWEAWDCPGPFPQNCPKGSNRTFINKPR